MGATDACKLGKTESMCAHAAVTCMREVGREYARVSARALSSPRTGGRVDGGRLVVVAEKQVLAVFQCEVERAVVVERVLQKRHRLAAMERWNRAEEEEQTTAEEAKRLVVRVHLRACLLSRYCADTPGHLGESGGDH
eukprot:6184599-Pleurochrysis_carterae.AAC.1